MAAVASTLVLKMVSSRLRWPTKAPVLISTVVWLRLVDDEVAAGFQLYLALQRTLDLVLHVVEIEDPATRQDSTPACWPTQARTLR